MRSGPAVGQAATVRLLLADSASLYWRAFHALPDTITAPDGTPVNAVRGFLDTLGRIAQARGSDRLVACWDDDWRPAWRVELVPSYKAHRVEEAGTVVEDPDAEEVPDLLSPQIPIIAEFCSALGIDVVGAPECEADDVIATLAIRHSGSGDDIDIASGDRDLVQLVGARVHLLYTGGTAKSRGGQPWVELDPTGVKERFEVAPDDYATMAALRGDPSDGLPGIPGIGQRTAVALIDAFGSLDAILSAAETDPGKPLTPKIAAALTEGADQVRRAYAVTHLSSRAHVPELAPPREPDRDRLEDLIDHYGLRASVQRLLEAMGSGQGAEE